MEKSDYAYDVIIIGAGIAGLFAAAKLSREGKKVLVFEQHSIAGGYATTFKRKGFTFEAGLHAVDGFFCENNPNDKIFREIGVLDNITFLRAPELYTLQRGDYSFTMADDVTIAKKQLLKHFPNEQKAIEKVFDELIGLRDEILRFPNHKPKALQIIDVLLLKYPKILRNLKKSLGTYIDKLTNDENLKLALTASTGYYHNDPYKYSMLHYGGCQGSFFTGGCAYIQGGSKKLVDYLVKYIESNNGKFLYNQKVDSVTMSGKKISGVITVSRKSGKEKSYQSNTIIANAAISTVISDMLPRSHSKKLKKRFDSYDISHSVFCLYLGLKKSYKDIGNSNYSTFILPKEATDFKNISNFYKTNDFNKKVLAFVDYSLVDSQLVDEGKTVATCAVIDEIDQWELLTKKEYTQKKEEVSKIILSRLEETLPGLTDSVEYYEAATPLTMKRYTLNPRGCIYGYAQSTNQVGPNRPELYSGIPGLYFASAWSKPGGGITAAAKCGYNAACKVLGL